MEAQKKCPMPGLLVRLYACCLGVIALSLLWGGVSLAALGGSPYYALAGAALAICAVMFWTGRRTALRLYEGIVVATVVWALWEVGLDGWALMSRIAAWFVVGTPTVLPGFRARLAPTADSSPGRKLWGWAGLGGALSAAVMVGLLLQLPQAAPFDPRFQTGFAPYPADRKVDTPISSSTDWEHWGRTVGGSRFSPLTSLTPANVNQLKPAWSVSVAASEEGRTGGLEVTPLMVGGLLYTCNHMNEVFALDAVSLPLPDVSLG